MYDKTEIIQHVQFLFLSAALSLLSSSSLFISASNVVWYEFALR